MVTVKPRTVYFSCLVKRGWMASARVASVGMEVDRLKIGMQSRATELGGRMG